MKKIKYIIMLLTVYLCVTETSMVSFVIIIKSTCYQCWEVSFGLGKATIEEKLKTMKKQKYMALHATKGLDKQIFGINYGVSMGVEGFFGDIKDHYHATVGLALFFTKTHFQLAHH